MRAVIERERGGVMLRVFCRRWSECAYVVLGLSGPRAEIEFPSDWHEQPRGWVRLGLGFVRVGVSFPWSRVVPDEYQCSGPTYGFAFFGDGLHLHWGKCKGTRGDPFTIIGMPWRWNHREHTVIGEPESHDYRYTLRDGEVQSRTATIQIEQRRWTRWWPPFWRTTRSIDVRFSDEVGERTGSWKGGVVGTSERMLRGETAVDTLRRMERDRRFS